MAGADDSNVPILFSRSQGRQTSVHRRFCTAPGGRISWGPRGLFAAVRKSGAERKQYPVLNGYSLGVGRMGLVETRRPVVLIVEDEFLLRMDAVDMIAAAGFEVVEAGNADKAIEILEARRDITVVFTDIQMPGSMDGLKLARAVRGRCTPIKIAATSGQAELR